MNLSLTDVRYFMEVATRQNITKAAKVLGISQPSLSSSLRRLERTLGTQLLLRAKSGARLTKPGILFQARAKELIGHWEELAAATRGRDRDVTAKYFIGCHGSLGLYTLPTFLPGLLEAHPQLEVELTHASSREVTEGVIDFRLDFGIVADPRPHPDLVIRKLGTDEVCFVVGETWKGPQRACELKSSVLICDPSIYQTQALLKALATKNIAFGRHLYTSRLDIVAALVDAEAGVGILPMRVAQKTKAKPFVPLAGLPRMKNDVCLIYRRESQVSPASRSIARFIEKNAKWER